MIQTKLAKVIKVKGMTYTEVAYMCGRSYETIRQLANGNNTSTKLSTIRRLMEVLDCRFEEIF